MELTINGKPFQIEGLSKAASAKSYPSVLFFAGGMCTNTGKSAKIRVTLSANNHRLKRWSETVHYMEADGQKVGDMFDGYVAKSDEVEAGLDVKVEINSGGGYKTIQNAAGGPYNSGKMTGLLASFDDGSGGIATFGVAITADI